VKQLDKESTNK